MVLDETYTIDRGLFHEFFILLGKLVHGDLVKQLQYLKVENQILRRKLPRRIETTATERQRLIKFGLAVGPGLRKIISIVAYSTYMNWRKDRPVERRAKTGRHKKPKEIRDLVLSLARENSWGYTRILGELKKLRIGSISRNTIKNILRENGFDPAPQRGEDSWDAFIKRHFETLWACDFFTKTVWTVLGPKTFHVLFFINVHTRKVHIAGMTQHPTSEWVGNATRSVSFLFQDDSKKVLIRDGDTKFGRKFDEIFKEWSTEVKRITYRSPNGEL